MLAIGNDIDDPEFGNHPTTRRESVQFTAPKLDSF